MAGNPALTQNQGAFGLDARDLKVADPNGVPSNLIIETGDPFSVELTVEFDGQLVDWILAHLGSFDVRYRYQEMGGVGADLGTTTVNVIANQRVYTTETTKNVVAGALPAGIYRLAAEVDFGPAPVAAFANGIELLVR